MVALNYIPKPYTLNPKPYTAKPYILNPQNPEPIPCWPLLRSKSSPGHTELGNSRGLRSEFRV